jgi:hypothetical protein
VRSRAPEGAALLLVVAALGACGGGDDGSEGGAAAGPGAGAGGEVLVDLVERNGSGQTGTATLTPSSEGTLVTVETVSYLVDPQPVAIYAGTCDALGEVAHELPTIEDGISVATLELEVADLSGAVSVAESRAKPDVQVACGEIG